MSDQKVGARSTWSVFTADCLWLCWTAQFGVRLGESCL